MKLLISAAGSLDGQIGGGQVYVQKLARELQRRGRDFTVVCEDTWAGGSEPFRAEWRRWEGVQVVGVSMNPAAATAGQRWANLSPPLLSALRQVVERVRPDMIHMNGLKPGLVEIATEKSIRHVITAHHGGIACPAGALLTPEGNICNKPMSAGVCAHCYCRQLSGGKMAGKALAALPPIIYRPLGQALNVLPNPTYAGRALMYPWLVERSIEGKQSVLRRGERFIAPSRAIARALMRNGVPADRITVLHHGIEPLPRVPLRNLENRPIRFGYVGQINRPKGVNVLLHAFSTLRGGLAELQIIGKPQRAGEQEYLDDALRALAGREDVKLLGAVSHQQMGRAMAGFDVLVLPSIFLEVFGLVILEAFSVGRPVIVTDSGGPPELVRDGIDGIVVPPGDSSALAAAMKSLIAGPRRISEMAAAIEPVRTLQQHVDDLEQILGTGVARAVGARA